MHSNICSFCNKQIKFSEQTNNGEIRRTSKFILPNTDFFCFCLGQQNIFRKFKLIFLTVNDKMIKFSCHELHLNI